MSKNRQRIESAIALGAYHARRGEEPHWKYRWMKGMYMKGYNSVRYRAPKPPPDGWAIRALKWLLSKMLP